MASCLFAIAIPANRVGCRRSKFTRDVHKRGDVVKSVNSMKVEHRLSTDILPAYRTPGMAPGDYIDVVRSEVGSLLKQTGGNPLKAVNLGFRRMRDDGLITDNDLKRLQKVSLIVISAEQGKHTQQEAVAKLDKLYLEAAADPES